MRYFIGNWKMFGVPSSINILHKINHFVKNDKNSKKYKVIITPPFTLLETFAKSFRNKKISIGAQNCYHKDFYSSNTGAISSYMIKALSCRYVIIGHSDNRLEGDTDAQLKRNQTFSVLKNQINKVLEHKVNKNNIIIAYEPIWSIGTGKIPSFKELLRTTIFIKKVLFKIFKSKKTPHVLYGGSVDPSNIDQFKDVTVIDGFLIGGASKSFKKFIDIIKNYYK